MPAEPLGTKVNLKEMVTPEALTTMKKGQLLHFQMEDGTDTWIKVIRAGFLRYEGEVVDPPLLPEAVEAMNEALAINEVDRQEKEIEEAKKEENGL